MTNRYARIDFTDKQRLEIFYNAEGRCQGVTNGIRCNRRITVKDKWIADHILPVALGGKTVIENGQLLGECCNPNKTADDIRRIRKADRQGKRHLGISKSHYPPLPGTKRSGWKRKMDGSVERRET